MSKWIQNCRKSEEIKKGIINMRRKKECKKRRMEVDNERVKQTKNKKLLSAMLIYLLSDRLPDRSRDDSLDITTNYRPAGGLILGRDKRFLSSPQCPDRLWDLPSLLPNGYRGLPSPGAKRL
jgi:hypothetical protein